MEKWKTLKPYDRNRAMHHDNQFSHMWLKFIAKLETLEKQSFKKKDKKAH